MEGYELSSSLGRENSKVRDTNMFERHVMARLVSRPLLGWHLDVNSTILGEASLRLALRALAIVGLIGLLPLVCAPAIAQKSDPKKARESLAKKTDALKSANERAETLKLDVESIRKERERLNTKLLDTAASIQKSEERMAAIESRLGELEEQERIVRGSLNQRKGQIAKLLGSLQRMGRDPPPVMITQREDALAMVRSAMLLAAAFPGLRSQALALANRLNELVRVMTEIREEGERLKSETKRLSDARTRLSGLMAEKKQTLAERQAELSEVQRMAAEISQNVDNLNELIVKLDEAVTRHTGLQEHNRKLKVAAALNVDKDDAEPSKLDPKSPTLPLRKEPLPIAPSGEEETQLAVLAPKSLGLAVKPNPGRIQPAIPFHLAKARLPMPAFGKRILSFGERTKYGNNSKGIVLNTRYLAQITSPCDGWIVYAGKFRSYGQLLIINAGGGYHVLLAGLSQIDVRPGQFVLAAEPVGTMSGARASTKKSSGSSSPVLYIEFRKDGQPINPEPWWVRGNQKAQG